METTVETLNGSEEAVEAAKLLKTHPVAAPAKAGMSTRAKAIAAAAIGALVLGAGGYFAATRGWVSTDDAFIEGHIVPVSAKVQGHVVKVLVDDNQTVAKGDVLAEIDSQDYETRRDDARADVEGALASVTKTELDAKRYQALYERRETSRQTVDHALADARSARAALAGAQARLRQAELNASYTKILAPQAGRVTRKTLEEGAFVSVGQPLLALVPKDVWVVANFKETELRDMRPGQRAEIKVDAYPGKLVGRVESLQAGTGARFSVLPPENATGNFVKVVQRMPVKIVLDALPDSGRLLGPGMSVEAEVKVN
jgi:membrane fusion protein (multidrug efflux system)